MLKQLVERWTTTPLLGVDLGSAVLKLKERRCLGEQVDELVHREVGLPDNGSQRSSSDFLMVRDGQRASSGVAQVHVAAFLTADHIAGFLERVDDRASRDDGQLAHTETSIRVSFTAPVLKRGNPSAASDRRCS